MCLSYYTDFISETQKKQIKLTKQVLLSISNHLSTRKECRGRVYRVAIGVKDPLQCISRDWPFNADNCIFFDIDVQIKPSRRKGEHRMPVIHHIIIDHFKDELFAGAANGNQVQIYPNKLLPGIYEYTKSASGKSRKWFRI